MMMMIERGPLAAMPPVHDSSRPSVGAGLEPAMGAPDGPPQARPPARQANVRLLEEIAQRERAEEALVQSQKLEALGHLTGSLAHDFNNLIASVTGYLHVAKRRNRDADVQVVLDKALAAAERGSKVTARLLTFARPDQPLNRAVDIRAQVAGMEDWLRQSLGAAITLELALEAGVELVAVTDANRFDLALLNLAINARDAMPEGGRVLLEVRRVQLAVADAELAAGDYVVVTLRDAGTGMSPAVAARAFDPFFTTKPGGRGSGLGLSQVYHLARQSGGSARIHSSPGEGTSVALWLQAGSADELQAEAEAEGLTGAGHGERILIVDDDADLRETTAQMLADHGYRVRVAGSGAQALEGMVEWPPDLLVLDFAMPGMSGAEVAKEVRMNWPQLPILFLSGHADLEALEAAAAGAQMLRKPFRTGDLFAAVRRCLPIATAPPG